MIASEHPEEALERAISGTLSLHERRQLEQHLALCAACKAHLALASMAHDSFKPRPRDEASDRLNVERALAFAARPSRPLPAPRRVLWLAAAALLAMGGLAAAAWLTPIARVSPKAAVSQTVVPKIAVQKPADEASHREAPQPIPELEATASSAPALDAPPVPLAPPAPMTASTLFRKASALRANGESEAAIAAFLKLQQLFPQSRESKLSLMIAGNLLLERGRPAQALEEFDHYLSQSGSASEHALAGRASALQSLGQSGAETSAWQRLLTAYPKSVYEQRAKARLSQLRTTQ